MRTTRSYRPAMSFDTAEEEMHLGAGSQFDPAVVEALLRLVRDRPSVVEHASVSLLAA
jgi:HD-GYP domain-containing protein (c-di-GMP phosphodiesterase class II)